MALLESMALLATLLILFGSNTSIAASPYNTPVQTQTLQGKAKMGTTTEYGFIGPSSERHPQFYSALIADGLSGQGLFYPERVKIEVSGTDPLGNTLLGDRFTALTVLLSPDDSGVQQLILKTIYDVLWDVAPSGLNAIVKNTVSSGGATFDRDSEKAWGIWQRPPAGYIREERGLRFGYQLSVIEALEGVYTINVHYHAWICWYDGTQCYHFGFIDLYDTVYYEYVNTPLVPSKPSGPTSGYTGVTYSYSTSTTDPNGDSVRYQFSWGDGLTTTTGWYTSGATATASHSWSSPGTYNVKVRAQDSTGAWSGWSPYLTVSIIVSTTSTFDSETSNSGYMYKHGQSGYPPSTIYGPYTSQCDVGQSMYWYGSGPPYFDIYRGYQSFDTSSLPDNAIITSVKLKLKCISDGSTTDFSVIVMGGSQPIYGTLATNDWGRGTAQGGSWNTANYPGDDQWITISLSTGSSFINKAGKTQFELKSSREGTTPSGWEYVRFYTAAKLEVTYYVP